MRFDINLRGDLAKLSDFALKERLESAWQTYESAKKPWFWWWPVLGRGPLRHPRAYRFLATLGNMTGGGSFDVLLAAALSGKSSEPFLRRADPAIDVYLILCEIRDLTDEMERRVAHRHAAKGASQ